MMTCLLKKAGDFCNEELVLNRPKRIFGCVVCEWRAGGGGVMGMRWECNYKTG